MDDEMIKNAEANIKYLMEKEGLSREEAKKRVLEGYFIDGISVNEWFKKISEDFPPIIRL